MSYFSYIQVLLIADLQEYKVNLCIQIGKFLKLLVQIAAVSIYSSPFIIWLIVELLFNLIVAYLLYHLVHRISLVKYFAIAWQESRKIMM